MRSIAKPILFSGTILLGIYLLLVLSANVILQLPVFRERLRLSLSSALRTTVSFQKLSLTPSLGISLSGIKTTPSGQFPSAEVACLTIHPSLQALLRGDFVPSSITLDRPDVALRLGVGNSETSSPMASSAAAPTSSPFNGINTTTGASTSPSSSPQASGAPGGGIPSPALNIPQLLASLTIRHGHLSILADGSKQLLSLKDLQASGYHDLLRIHATSAIINDAITLHSLSAEAAIEGSSLSMKNISAIMGDGRVTGTLRCGLPPESPDYNGSLQLVGASLSKLLADASLGSPSAQGVIDGDLTLAGTAGSGATMTGKGSLRCKESTIEPVDFLKQIGQLLNIDELKLLKLSEGRCLFRIDQGRVVIDELFLRSENLILSAVGPVQPSGELNLDSRLLFNEKLTGRLRRFLGSQMTQAPEAGYSQISFHVTGPMSNPKTDLIERLTGIHFGGNLGGLGNLIQGLFGRPPQPAQPPPQPAH